MCTVKVPTTPWSTTVVNLGAIRRADVPLGRTDARVDWMSSRSISRFRGWRNGDGRRTEKRGRGCYRSSAPSTERRRKQNAGPGRWRTVGGRGANQVFHGAFKQTPTVRLVWMNNSKLRPRYRCEFKFHVKSGDIAPRASILAVAL